MGFSRGPKIVTDNLFHYVDPRNVKSYPGTGTSVLDLSGNSRNMTLINGATVTDGVFVLDGANDYVNYSFGTLFDWTAIPYSVSFWAKPTDFTYPTVIDLIAAGNGHFRFQIGSSDIRSQFRTPGGSSASLVTYSVSISSGNWYHCTFTRSGTTFKAYLNGTLGATNTTSHLGSTTTGMSVIRIGYSADYDAGDRTFEGSVGPVNIYDKTLTASEVLQNYNATKGRFGL